MTVTSGPTAGDQPGTATERVPASTTGASARGICPFLIADDGSWRSAVATRDQRCGALAPAPLVAPDKQRRLCLSAAHRACGTYRAAAHLEGLPAERLAAAVERIEGGVTRWALARTMPVVLDTSRVASVALVARRRTGAQVALGGIMVLALVAVVLARLPGGSDPALVGATISPSPIGAATPAVAPTLPPPTSPPSSPPTASSPAATPPPAPSPSRAASPSVPASTPVPARTYRVREGDTLYGIAIQFGTTVRAIQAANGMGDSTAIRTGQVLRLP